jgi:ElaA protein
MKQEPVKDVIWRVKSWSELGREELYSLLKLRSEVFVVEQDCVYQDLDDKDKDALHVWMERAGSPAEKGGEILATTRLLPAGSSYEAEVSIGRVVTAQSLRRDGWGRELMRRSLDEVHLAWEGVPIRISAQKYLEAFYASFGFSTVGEPYLEDGIPHVAMTRPAGPA